MQANLNSQVPKTSLDVHDRGIEPGGMTKLPAPALMLASVLSIQFGQAVGKRLSGAVGAPGTVALRLGLAAVLLLLVYRPSLPRSRTDTLLVLGFGTAIAGMNLIYPALLLLPLGLASALQLLGPITLALLTSRRLRDVGWAVLAGCGVWLFHAPHGARFPLPGVLLALAAGVSMAVYLLLSKKAGSRGAGGGPLALAVTWAAVLTVPLGVVSRGTELLAPGRWWPGSWWRCSRRCSRTRWSWRRCGGCRRGPWACWPAWSRRARAWRECWSWASG
ncbi:hypothetical protein SVIO_022650 [Streptomyces violaceusniger]|uniref:EamA domain-containing protein n=1 Tax=Streptomyces violaceusniger TaxID=68280 RepID=A0A4D4KSI0_STRVO|nr:hypothetical protein SVIO_022650 [Streptomyces violaceusniger]